MNSMEIPKEMLSEMWDEYNFKIAEEKVSKWQKELTKAAMLKNDEKVKKLSFKITSSLEARYLAVREVSEINAPAVGVDGIRWVTSEEKMHAVFDLRKEDYKAKNYKRFVITDVKTSKERRVNIPAMQDRAMQILHMYALSPISEATADRKSFAYRKGRSALDVHALIMHTFIEKEPPKYVVICDVKSYYDSISHEWLLNNIPMNKHVLYQFLKSGIVFNNELFPPEETGISLGCNISTILGNMTLDGLQYVLYDLQDRENIDYYDGYVIRFADDILITARSESSAKIFLEKVKNFVNERGLKLSEEKTYITTIDKGFDFLSRHYYRENNIVRCKPSALSVIKFESDLATLINSKKRWSQKKLIDTINAKLNGWATYHRVEESLEAFMHIDNVITALLVKLMKDTHPKTAMGVLTKKYWYLDNRKRQIFALPSNKNIKIIKLEDVILVNHKRLNTSKNIYLDEEYFKDRNINQDIQKVSNKYKMIWERQEGKCYYCDNPIKINQHKRIIIKNLTIKDNSIRNMAYVHEYCINSDTTYINIENNVTGVNINDVICSVNDIEVLKTQTKSSKYANLYEYFARCEKPTFCIKFSKLEEIIGCELCKSLYEKESYWFVKGKNLISNCWTRNGYKVKRVFLTEKKVTFIRAKKQLSKINIPDKILSSNIPKTAKDEIERFFDYIIDKYGL